QMYAKHEQNCGATAVMAIPPVAVVLPESQLRAYYQQIIESVAIPTIMQDASGYVGRPMSIELQAELFKEFGPQRVMFKPEAAPIGPRLRELHEATGGKAIVFEGTGGVALLDSHRRGIAGTMPGADLIKAIVALWRGLDKSDAPRADRIS